MSKENSFSCPLKKTENIGRTHKMYDIYIKKATVRKKPAPDAKSGLSITIKKVSKLTA